ncbi:efflux RND transporter permease subunit [Anaerotardibacter muris]|uniref:efflux RND transporter permease subunit n=1 Tax=Anaerotardibacter muris TaxID=2941505 RepID=UPI00203A8426|nr:efflux RND transporter permease subunit [Anaerotardibacter muris]
MLSKFSVKRPYIIVVAVIIALILGGVSVSKMKTDLLPEMDIPYLMVITTDPGASAEKVEVEVTDVLEDALSKVNGVSEIQSQSANNYSMVVLEFEDGADMDSAMVKVSSAVNEVQSLLPETAGSPNYMEMSMDMMATLYIACSYDGKDIYELSDFSESTLAPAFERINGVADVSVVGAVNQSVEVRLNESKIEDINNRLLSSVNSELSDAKKSIDEGKSQLTSAESALKKQQEDLASTEKTTTDQLGQTISGLTLAVSSGTAQVAALNAQIQSLQAQLAAAPEAMKPALNQQIAALQEQLTKATGELSTYQNQLAAAEAGGLSAASQFGSGSAQLAAALSTLEQSKTQLDEAQAQYEDARDKAISSANIDALVDKNTLASLIKAQDFSMPAGYLGNSTDDEQWLLQVGTNIASLDELRNLMLVDLDNVGEIRLEDVADITLVDNVGDAYMRLNGAEGTCLTVFKSSTASTSDISNACREEAEKLRESYPGLTLDIVSDQGSYISLYINSILQSLLLGAFLAIIVLAIFLRSWKPTLIVAFSIPFSVLVALLLMYFSGISLNIMSLGGIALAIGMLVDNSIIVLENIYRLRGRGIPAQRAAVQGAKQITGAVIASTLTTICVFLPIVFTTGIVNQLMLPFALTIAYVLCASLVVALTLVPSLSRFVFRNYVPRQNKWFEKLQESYGRSLNFFLKHKVIPLAVSVVLLVVAIGGVVNMGITMIPTMTGKNMSVTVIMPEDVEKEDAFAMADDIMDAAVSIEGVGNVAAIDGTSTISMVSSTSSSSDNQVYDMFMFYLQMDDSVTTEQQVLDIGQELADKTAGLDCEVITDASSSEAMSSMMGSGLSVTITGPDQDELLRISEDVMGIIDEVEGYTEIENGMEEADHELHLIVDEDKLTREGFTVAQLYQQLAGMLNTSTTSSKLAIDGTQVQVEIIDETNVPTREDILDTVITMTSQQGESVDVKLGDVATVEEGLASDSIVHLNSNKTMTVTAEVEDSFNNALLSRELTQKLDAYDVPDDYQIYYGGELENINTMLEQMMLLLILGFVLIYLIMVAQFQSLLSPFIIILTVPLAFTGGFFALWFSGEGLTMLSMMGFAVLMGTVVNNGIVFVDYVNQLRRGGLEKHHALVAAGKTRMRPIMMTALTTILAMLPMVFSVAIGASMERGMALVVVGGLLYATFMTLYVVPIMYDLLYRRVPTEVDLGDETLDDDPGDAQAFLETLQAKHAAQALDHGGQR